MILQLGAIFGTLARELIPAGVDIGRQFLERELQRDARRAQKDLIKAQAAAGGLGSGSPFNSQTPGAFSPPFAPTVPAGVFPSLGGPSPRLGPMAPIPLPGPTVMRADLPAALNGRVQGPTFSPATLGTQTFVLDPETGCLRQTMPGEKSTHRFDPRRGFVRKKPRRMNPLNVKAARRAARRVDATLDAVKSLVSISEASKKGVRAGGKVVKFRTRPKRRRKVC